MVTVMRESREALSDFGYTQGCSRVPEVGVGLQAEPAKLPVAEG